MVYYTIDLENAVKASVSLGETVRSFIQGMVDGANTIYRVNGIPMKLDLHCVLRWDKSEKDQPFARAIYKEFKEHRGTVNNLLNGADMAVLLTQKEWLLRLPGKKRKTRPL